VKLLKVCSRMPLEVTDAMQNGTHDELVEQDYTNQCRIDQENALEILRLSLSWL
jgi:hypothetical protein